MLNRRTRVLTRLSILVPLSFAISCLISERAAALACPEGICPCNSSQYDVVAWMTGTYYTQNPYFHMESTSYSPGYNSPVYTTIWPQTGSTPGYIWFSKSSSGYPWDVDSFDSNYVYFAYTNYQPSGGAFPDYAQYVDEQKNPWGFYPIAPRCVPKSLAGTPYASLSIPYNAADWVNVTCQDGKRKTSAVQNLGGANMQMWPPTAYPGLPSPLNSQQLMALVYSYSWQNGAYQSIEKSYYNPTYGWVGWELWNYSGGTYKKTQYDYLWTVESSGNITPVQPACGG